LNKALKEKANLELVLEDKGNREEDYKTELMNEV